MKKTSAVLAVMCSKKFKLNELFHEKKMFATKLAFFFRASDQNYEEVCIFIIGFY
jgi:hypothetical protein